MVQNALDKPSTEPHSTPVCSAIISSRFYRLVFFFLHCAVRKISLILFRPFKCPHLVCLQTSLSKVSPRCCPCWGGSLQSPLETGPMPPVLGWPCLLLEDDRGCLSSKLQGKPGHREIGQQPKPTLGVCTNRSGNAPGLPELREKYHHEQM